MEFNATKEKTSTEEETRTVNYEGGEAFSPKSPEMGLYKAVINNLLEDSYYEEDTDALDRVIRRFDKCADEDDTFPLKLATFARQEMYLRDISQVLLVLSANDDRTKQYVRHFAPKIIDRADEPCTVVAIQLELFDKPIPKPLKKGINDSLHHFDEYEFSKYDSSRRQVNLKDVLNLCHPKPRDEEHEEIFERLMKGDLDGNDVDPLSPPETWEVVISERGNTKEAWIDVLPEMGMFAKIRNLRNMIEAGVDSEQIFDEDDLEYVRESKLFPFRFYQSYRAIKDAGIRDEYAEDWLSEAVEVSAENLPDELANTHVAVDTSGSMNSAMSNRSTLRCVDISTLFGAVLWKKGADLSAFADDWERINPHHDAPVFSVMEEIKNAPVGGSTNGWKVPNGLREEGDDVDRIVLLTDMVMWDSTTSRFHTGKSFKECFQEYRNEVNPEANLYSIDLQSYGDLSTPEEMEGVYNISGWNEKVIDFVEYAEKPGEVIEEIRSIN